MDVDGGKLVLCAGAPRAHGDEEERMLRTVRAIADAGLGLPVQIGVHRGRAFTGDIGPDYRRTYTAMGDVVNLAARLMGKAPAGGIYATGGVLDHSAAPFARDALAPLELKGKAAPVDAWSVGPPAARTPAAPHPDAALTGRTEELAALRDALAAARGGEGRYVEVAGAPGVGKTALLDALRREAVGLPVILATCEAHGGASPYAPWRELLIELIDAGWDEPADIVLGRLRAVVGARAPELAPWLPLLAVPFGIETEDTPEVARLAATFRADRLHRTVVRFLAASLPDPAVLVIEHAHDMDAASAALLDAVLAAVPLHPWLILATRRDAPGGFAAQPATGRTFLRLDPLGPAATQALAGRLTEDAPLPPSVLALAAERSAGNPQFLRDLLATAGAGGEGLSETLEAAATARIDRLDPQDRALVRRTSVLGMSFHPRMLGEMLEGAPLPDDDAWQRLRDVFADDGDGWYRFRIGVLRDAAYAGLPFRTRRRLHAAAGARLEQDLGAAAPDHAARLSLHFFEAGDHARAWHYALHAGEQARARGAHADAAQFYSRAADAARGADAPAPELAAALVDLGEALARSGRPERAHAAYRRARKIVAADPVRASEVLLHETELADRADDARLAVRSAMRALRTLDGILGADAARCRARVLAALALSRQRQGRSNDAIALCLRAIAEGEAAGEDRAIAHACHLLDWALHDVVVHHHDPVASGDRPVDQRALPRAGDPGEHAEHAERDVHVDAAQVVRRRVADLERAGGLPHRALQRGPVVQVPAGDRAGAAERLEAPLEDHLSPGGARARAEVDHVVGDSDGLRLVLDDEHRVALVAQPEQELVHPFDVMGVQPDGRLVEDVGDVGQRRPEVADHLGPLRLAPGQRPGRPVQ